MKKNNDEILYNSISNIDENIIASSLVYKPKSKKIIIWASLAACLCAVSVTYAVIYKNNFNKPVNNSEVLSTTNSSSDFHIYSLPKVLSENSENSKQKVLLSPVKTLLDSNTGIHAITYTVNFKSDGSPYDERDTSYSGNIIKQDLFDISPDSIEFSIASDAVEYYNVTVKNNCISYQSDSTVFSGQKSFENIKISDNGFITWRPTCEKFSTEILSITGKEEPDYNSNILDRTAYSDAEKTVYDSIKNFDEYFGEELILLDDPRYDSLLPSDWLKLLDPLNKSYLSARYKNKLVVGRLIIMTNYLSLAAFFGQIPREDLNQYLRRFHHVIDIQRRDDGKYYKLSEMRPLSTSQTDLHFGESAIITTQDKEEFLDKLLEEYIYPRILPQEEKISKE